MAAILGVPKEITMMTLERAFISIQLLCVYILFEMVRKCCSMGTHCCTVCKCMIAKQKLIYLICEKLF